ncbi:MAG: hypothetical protein AUJ04_03295 [Acidobacteria bacterium 13_1_40CM_3_55_6]|nr:MAG: hypothetical protein AUJ04_03295 [Acidobacteria bacterium 13_1_40CM_3_55_6]
MQIGERATQTKSKAPSPLRSAGALHKIRMLFAIWGALLVITRSRRKVTVKNKRQEFMRQLAIGEIT